MLKYDSPAVRIALQNENHKTVFTLVDANLELIP